MICYVIGYIVDPYPEMQYMMTFADRESTAIEHVRQHFRERDVVIKPQFIYEEADETLAMTQRRRVGRPSRERRPTRARC